MASETESSNQEKHIMDQQMIDGELNVPSENKTGNFVLGGAIDKPAFALLTGIYEVRTWRGFEIPACFLRSDQLF